jgi:hypothetical protein
MRPLSRAGVRARLFAARLRGLSLRTCWARFQSLRSMIALCSPGYEVPLWTASPTYTGLVTIRYGYPFSTGVPLFAAVYLSPLMVRF